MPVFALVVEYVRDPMMPIENEGLNEKLRTLQGKGAKILDVKLSSCHEVGLIVTYLITYEANKQLT